MIRASFTFCIFVYSLLAYGHGTDNGPTTLEEEFSRLSHIHLPLNFNTKHGLSFGYSIGHGHGHGDHDDHGDHGDHDGDISHDDDFGDHHGEDDGGDHHDDHDGDGFDMDIHPVIFAGLDKIKRLVNLDQAGEVRDILEEADEKSKFLYIKGHKWDFGFGVEADIHLPVSLAVFGFGVSLLRGKNYYSHRILNGKDEKREKLKLPLSKENMKSWRAGDKLSYAVQGGIVFNAMVGIEPLVHFGPLYIHNGGYHVNVFLESENHLEVSITTTKTNAVGVEGHTVVASFEALKGHASMNNIVYEFDLKSESSYKAIKHLFKGRTDLANQELLNSNGEIVLRSYFKNKSLSMTGSFGIPVLFSRGMTIGDYSSSGRVEREPSTYDDGNHTYADGGNTHDDGEHNHDSEEVYTFSKLKSKFSRGVWSKHFSLSKLITSTMVRGVNKSDDSILSSQFNWHFERDKVSSKEFKKKIKKIAKKLGFEFLRKIRLPFKKNGYTRVDLGINLSGGDLLFLLHKDKSKSVLKLATENIDGKDREKVIEKFEKIDAARAQAEKFYLKGLFEKSVKEIAILTNELFSSKHLTQALFKLREDLYLNLRVLGERIKQHHYECRQTCELM